MQDLTRSHYIQLHAARNLAQEIIELVDGINPMLDSLCQLTCRYCSDICCKRATVWYDFRDILILVLSSSSLPEQQIIRSQIKLNCPFLSPSGCTQSRSHRPFLCNWYLCPEQKKVAFQQGLTFQHMHIVSAIEEIQSKRKHVENVFRKVIGKSIATRNTYTPQEGV